MDENTATFQLFIFSWSGENTACVIFCTCNNITMKKGQQQLIDLTCLFRVIQLFTDIYLEMFDLICPTSMCVQHCILGAFRMSVEKT